MIFLFFMNLLADFFKCFKCRLFTKNSRNLQKMVLNIETLHTKNWTRLQDYLF